MLSSEHLIRGPTMRMTHIFFLTTSVMVMVLGSGVRHVAGEQAYHVGLDFIEASATSSRFAFDFEPYAITSSENYFVTQGGLSGWTEDQARRAVALAVDATLRDIDVGDPDRTVRIATYIGRAPVTLSGQRLNVVIGQSSHLGWSLLGETGGVYDDPFANDAYVAATYVDEIDKLGSELVTYDTPAGAINAIAGTVAHEIGHVFGASHVPTSESDPAPLPLMAIFSTGLAWEARLDQRRFSMTMPEDTPNTDRIYLHAGTVLKGDLNLDTLVDSQDWQEMVTHWGLDDRLYHEGDVNGDQRVNAIDAGIMFANWNGDLPSGSGASTGLVAFGCDQTSSMDQVLLPRGMAVPEPAGLMLAAMVLLGWMLTGRQLVYS